MKKTLLLIASGAALFAAGYWTRDNRTAGDSSGTKPGPDAAAAAARAVETPARSSAALPENEVRAFTAGRPFARGGAKAWLLGLAAQLGGDLRSKQTEMLEMARDFMTMDEASASETCKALIEILALRKTGDPLLKAIEFNGDLVDSAYTQTVLRLSQLNPADAITALKNMPREIPARTVKLIFGRLAGQDLTRAEEMARTLPLEISSEPSSIAIPLRPTSGRRASRTRACGKPWRSLQDCAARGLPGCGSPFTAGWEARGPHRQRCLRHVFQQAPQRQPGTEVVQ